MSTTGCADVVLAGGVAMNCSANGVLARDPSIDGLYVPPFAYDCGVAIGAALLAAKDAGLTGMSAVNGRVGAYLGREFPDRVPEAAQSEFLTGDRLSDAELVDCVVDHLTAGRLVGWYQGRAEVGQRAGDRARRRDRTAAVRAPGVDAPLLRCDQGFPGPYRYAGRSEHVLQPGR